MAFPRYEFQASAIQRGWAVSWQTYMLSLGYILSHRDYIDTNTKTSRDQTQPFDLI